MKWKEVCPMCPIGCKEAEKLAAGAEKTIKCPETGAYFFKDLPENYRKANQYDLFINTMPKEGTKVLLKSFHGPNFQGYVVKSSTCREWLMTYMLAGHCFVK